MDNEEMGLTVELSRDDVARLIDALDSHEYWQVAEHGRRLPVDNGAVWLPGDYIGPAEYDRYWPTGLDLIDHETVEAIEQARELRFLIETLEGYLHAESPDGAA